MVVYAPSSLCFEIPSFSFLSTLASTFFILNGSITFLPTFCLIPFELHNVNNLSFVHQLHWNFIFVCDIIWPIIWLLLSTMRTGTIFTIIHLYVLYHSAQAIMHISWKKGIPDYLIWWSHVTMNVSSEPNYQSLNSVTSWLLILKTILMHCSIKLFSVNWK